MRIKNALINKNGCVIEFVPAQHTNLKDIYI
jgi:hypothetical protein